MKELRKLFKDINLDLVRKFKQLFQKDESGISNRDWKQMTKIQITVLFDQLQKDINGFIETEFT